MKKMILITAFLFGGFAASKTEAQVSVNVNIGVQPLWGPIGYDYVEYYYMPDIEVYYWVPRRQYVYFSGGRWIFATSLPVAYRSYNLYSGYKVVINEPRAYLHFNNHKIKYKTYKGNYGKQTIIRSSNDPKYYVVKGHPKYKGKAGNPGKGNKSNPGKGNKKGKN
jgi:hypothetical protein